MSISFYQIIKVLNYYKVMQKKMTKRYLISLVFMSMLAIVACEKKGISPLDNAEMSPEETLGNAAAAGVPDPYDPKIATFVISSENMDGNGRVAAYSNPTNFGMIFTAISPNGQTVACAVTVVLSDQNNNEKKALSQKYQFTTDPNRIPDYQNKYLACTINTNDVKDGDGISIKLEYVDSKGKPVSVITGGRHMISKTPSHPGTSNRPFVPNIPANAKYMVPPFSFRGYRVLATNGTYHLDMQDDGNLVLYKDGYNALWASRTGDYGPSSKFEIQEDGGIRIYSNDGRHWSGTLSRASYSSIWILQDDGNLVIYDSYSVDANGNVTVSGEALGATMTQGGRNSNRSGKFI
jgi:hypothetical protein